MKQLSFLPKRRLEHGGKFALHRRRSKRPFSTKQPVHLVLRSELAIGHRSLLKHRLIVDKVMKKFSKHFRIRVYEYAICGNHIHCLVKGQTRTELQHFFRVLAGQIAQEILNLHPLQKRENKAFAGGTPGRPSHPKNQRTFWSLLTYSRVVTWGREYLQVKAYVVRNSLEALGLIAYTERKRRYAFSQAGPSG